MFRGRVICGLLMVSYLFKPNYANIVPKMQDKLYRLKYYLCDWLLKSITEQLKHIPYYKIYTMLIFIMSNFRE